MLGTFINFSNDFVSSTLSYAGTIVSDLQTPLMLILGVLFGILVLSFLIRALSHH